MKSEFKLAQSPMPFGVQSLIPPDCVGSKCSNCSLSLQCLSAFSPLFPNIRPDEDYEEYFVSPMPFGVQSLIPPRAVAYINATHEGVSNAFRRSVPYSR